MTLVPLADALGRWPGPERWTDPPAPEVAGALAAARDDWRARCRARGDRWPAYREPQDLALLAFHEQLFARLVPIDAIRAADWLAVACGPDHAWELACPSGGRCLVHRPTRPAEGQPARLDRLRLRTGQPALALTGAVGEAYRDRLTTALTDAGPALLFREQALVGDWLDGLLATLPLTDAARTDYSGC